MTEDSPITVKITLDEEGKSVVAVEFFGLLLSSRKPIPLSEFGQYANSLKFIESNFFAVKNSTVDVATDLWRSLSLAQRDIIRDLYARGPVEKNSYTREFVNAHNLLSEYEFRGILAGLTRKLNVAGFNNLVNITRTSYLLDENSRGYSLVVRFVREEGA